MCAKKVVLYLYSGVQNIQRRVILAKIGSYSPKKITVGLHYRR